MKNWYDNFDGRQRQLINNCRTYAASDPGGLPGHNIMLIVSKMADLLDETLVDRPVYHVDTQSDKEEVRDG